MKSDQITLVLLPGLNGTEALFKPLLDIAPNDVKTLCISYPTHEQKSYLELAAHVSNKLKSLEGDYLLLGESFSGPIAILVCQANPKGLLGIILVATFISPPTFRVGRFLPWRMLFSLAKPLYMLKQLMKSKGKPFSILDAALLEAQKCSPRVLAARITEIFKLDIKRELSSCSKPIIYFSGEKDYAVPWQNLKEILKIKPDIGVARFNTGHFLLQSAPAEAWAAINKFRVMSSERHLQ